MSGIPDDTGRIDEVALGRYLRDELGGNGVPNVEHIGAVQSTKPSVSRETTTSSSSAAPAYDFAAGVLHNLHREYDVLDALDALADTDVPAPLAILACEDERFYRAQAVHRVVAIVASFFRAHLSAYRPRSGTR